MLSWTRKKNKNKELSKSGTVMFKYMKVKISQFKTQGISSKIEMMLTNIKKILSIGRKKNLKSSITKTGENITGKIIVST